MELEVDIHPPEQRLRRAIEITLFRIAQEALSNMARHSDASEGRLVLKTEGDEVILLIEDDGRGFDHSGGGRTGGGTGLGLSGMEERTRLLGGTWTCKSEPGQGTRVMAKLPLHYRG
jgi:signal transduction histidine kinase